MSSLGLESARLLDAFAVFVGGLLAGFVFSWWGLLAAIGFACFLAYTWEFSAVGVIYAAIGGAAASVGIAAGALLAGKYGHGGPLKTLSRRTFRPLGSTHVPYHVRPRRANALQTPTSRAAPRAPGRA